MKYILTLLFLYNAEVRYALQLRHHSDHLAFFRRTLGTRLGGKCMKNARFEQFGGRFEVV